MQYIFARNHYASHVTYIIIIHKMGGQAECLVCAAPAARTPIGVSGNFNKFSMMQRVYNYFILVMLNGGMLTNNLICTKIQD